MAKLDSKQRTLYFYYFKNIFWINLFGSILFAALVPVRIPLFDNLFFSAFSFFFLTSGYAFSVCLYNYFGKRTKYIYFNMGLSFVRMYVFGFVLNLLFITSLYFALLMVT